MSWKQAKGWKAPTKEGTADPEHQFAAVKPPSRVDEPSELQDSNHVPALGDSAWQDDGTLQWKLYNEKQVVVEGFVSLQIPAFVKGPQPQERQLVLINPTKTYDLEHGADLGIARGVEWWYPHTPLHCKVVNVTKLPITLQRGMTVASVYALNASDVERIKLLHESLPNPMDTDEGTAVPSQDETT